MNFMENLRKIKVGDLVRLLHFTEEQQAQFERFIFTLLVEAWAEYDEKAQRLLNAATAPDFSADDLQAYQETILKAADELLILEKYYIPQENLMAEMEYRVRSCEGKLAYYESLSWFGQAEQKNLARLDYQEICNEELTWSQVYGYAEFKFMEYGFEGIFREDFRRFCKNNPF